MVRELRASDAACSIAQAAAVIGDWWSLLIVREVVRGHHRFDELLGELGISRKVLTERLKHLVEHDVLRREPYQTGPVRYEYLLTPAGSALAPVLITMQDWADRWLAGDGTLTGVAAPDSTESARVHALLDTPIPHPLTLTLATTVADTTSPTPPQTPTHAPSDTSAPATPPPQTPTRAPSGTTAPVTPPPRETPTSPLRAASLTLPATSSASAAATMVVAGDEATAGLPPSLGGGAGRRVDVVADAAATVLFAYPATGVPADWRQVPGAMGCTLENRLFRDHYAEFAADGIAIRGVSTQRPDEQAAFAAAEGIPFPLLSDMDLQLAAALRLPTFRADQSLRLKRLILVIDRARVIRHVIFPVLDIPAAVTAAHQAARKLTRP